MVILLLLCSALLAGATSPVPAKETRLFGGGAGIGAPFGGPGGGPGGFGGGDFGGGAGGGHGGKGKGPFGAGGVVGGGGFPGGVGGAGSFGGAGDFGGADDFGGAGGFGGNTGFVESGLGGGCKNYCKKGGRYTCCDNDKGGFGGVKLGECPPVRPTCPRFKNPQICDYDGECGGIDKCCFDKCLGEKVCKPPSPDSGY